MTKPEFKDEYVMRAILENGKCYSVKPHVKKSLKNAYQNVIFALELQGNDLNKIKDMSKGEDLNIETTKKKGFIKIKEDLVITTSADVFENMDKFLKFYESTDIPVGDFIDECSDNLSQSNKNQKKPTARPKRK